MIKKFSLSQLAELTQSELCGDPGYLIAGVADLENASSEDASFLANPRYREAMIHSKAGVVCIDPQTPLMEGKNFLISADPSRCFQKILEIFFSKEENISGFPGIHPTSVVHSSVKIGQNVQIGPYVVVDKNAEIGDNTILMAFVSIGPNVKMGTDCLLYPHTIVRERCIIGNRVVIQPGAVIGSCGFGFTTDAKGRHHKLEQLGIVIIDDDVEIGANTTIDRARFKTTRISRGTKLDNLVQIGHNVHLGEDNIIVSQTGIAGSTKTGKNVVTGGQAGIVGHLEIADHVMIATRGGVSKSILKSGKYAGSPVMPLSDYNRQQVMIRKIETYVKEIEQLKDRLKQLEQQAKTYTIYGK
jgi:UDP-3-O-[3-hydroxymyristoyl] glucosamine N-acyltransferase